MTVRPIEILLVEDSPGDVWLTREILLQGSVPKRIHVVHNGEQALEFLFRQGPYTSAPRPDVVLLDLNLPRKDGFEVLREIKRDPDLRAVTVVVLTTSQAASDVNAAYDLNANCYIVKPVDLEEFTVVIRGIEEFWMSMAVLPTNTPPVVEGEERADSATSGPSAELNGPHMARHMLRRKRYQPATLPFRYPERHAPSSLHGSRPVAGSSSSTSGNADSRHSRHRHRR